MVRGADPALVAEMSKPVWYPILFVYLDWPGEEIRVHSNRGMIEWGGHEWAGVGRFGAIGSPQEMLGMQAHTITMALVGLPPEVLDFASVPIRNRPGEVYIGATTEAGAGTLVGDPYMLIAGYMDALRYTIQREGEQTEHALQLDLGVGPSARSAAAVFHSAESQAAKHPGDTAGRHLIEIEKRVQVMTWPES